MYCISSLVVCKIDFCSEFSDIPDSTGRNTRRRKRRRRAQAIAKCYAFHANAKIHTFLLFFSYSKTLYFASMKFNKISISMAVGGREGVWINRRGDEKILHKKGGLD